MNHYYLQAICNIVDGKMMNPYCNIAYSKYDYNMNWFLNNPIRHHTLIQLDWFIDFCSNNDIGRIYIND